MPDSSIPSYPEELLWQGREPDQVFDDDEYLFYRAKAVDERGKLGSVDVMWPNVSVNRGKYSKPIHVLYAKLPMFLSWLVMEFHVRDIPPELIHPDQRKYQFAPVHDPVKPPIEPDENYAHAEIRMFQNQQPTNKAPELVKKQFRQLLADRMEQVPAANLEA